MSSTSPETKKQGQTLQILQGNLQFSISHRRRMRAILHLEKNTSIVTFFRATVVCKMHIVFGMSINNVRPFNETSCSLFVSWIHLTLSSVVDFMAYVKMF